MTCMTKMIDFKPETFESHFRAVLAGDETEVAWALDEIDDALQAGLQNSADARACACLAADVLADTDHYFSLAYALNTAIAASCMSGDTERARRYLSQLVDLTIEKKTDSAALSAAENVRQFLPWTARADHAPNVFAEVVRLYLHLQKFSEAIRTLITVAYIYSDFGAFPSAYRALHEAEDLARDNRLLQEYTDVVSTTYSICLLEEDHAYAEQLWPTLKQKYKDLGKRVPTHVAINRATLLFRSKQYGAAREAYEEALAGIEEGDEADEVRARTLINLSACLRDVGEIDLSDERLAEARALMGSLEAADPEMSLEAELIAAKSAVAKGDFVEAAACLNRAANHLDAGVAAVEKLHYRRGFRERYIPRMERLLARLPATGRADDVIAVIAATRANRMSDWLHFLEWAEALASKMQPEQKLELDDLVERLAAHGSPHLYGYLEKYDDPLVRFGRPDPWREIAEYADKATAMYGVARPFEGATAERISRTISQRLDSGFAVLVNMVVSGHKMLLLVGDRYVQCDLPEAETRTFFEALLRHRSEPDQKKALGVAVGVYQPALLNCMAPVLQELEAESCNGVIFIPDGWNLTPITLAMVGDPKIRARMTAGAFEVRTCIAPHPATITNGAPTSCLGIIERDSGLSYDKADVESFFRGVEAEGTLLTDPSWDSFAEVMASTDVLVLSHHGSSIGLFADPFVANMAGPYRKSAMSLARLQGAAYRWPHRLAVLGTCHSGGLVNRNHQGHFSSHDLIGFPTVFLLNGRAEVTAASWAILDRFHLLFTNIFAPALKTMHPSRAASTALAQLFDMPVDELAKLLDRAFPSYVERTPQLLAEMDNLRRQPFCYGAYQTYTLL